jgi:hypothetical protein
MTAERPQLTKSQAINNQWVIAQHRLTYAKEHNNSDLGKLLSVSGVACNLTQTMLIYSSVLVKLTQTVTLCVTRIKQLFGIAKPPIKVMQSRSFFSVLPMRTAQAFLKMTIRQLFGIARRQTRATPLVNACSPRCS